MRCLGVQGDASKSTHARGVVWPVGDGADAHWPPVNAQAGSSGRRGSPSVPILLARACRRAATLLNSRQPSPRI